MGSPLPINPFQTLPDWLYSAAANDDVELTLRLVKDGEEAEAAAAGAEGAEAVSLATEAVDTVATVTEVGAATSYAVALAPSAVLFLAGDSSPRMPKILPVVDKPPQGQTAPAWMTQIDDLANKMQQISEMQQLIHIYQLYGLTSLADKVRRDLEGLQLQITTSASSTPVMGNRLQIKAMAGAAELIDRYKNGIRDEEVENLGLDTLAEVHAAIADTSRNLVAARVVGSEKMAEKFDTQLNALRMIQQRLLLVNMPVAPKDLVVRQSLMQRAGTAMAQVFPNNITLPQLMTKSVTEVALPVLAGVSIVGYTEVCAKLFWYTVTGQHTAGLFAQDPVASIAIGSALGMIMRHKLGAEWRESWRKNLNNPWANSDDFTKILVVAPAAFNAVVGSWAVWMALANHLGASVDDYTAMPRADFRVALGIGLVTGALMGTVYRINGWWKALSQFSRSGGRHNKVR